MMEVISLSTTARVVSLCQGGTPAALGLTLTQMPVNSGDRVIFIWNCATEPSVAPVSGYVLYSVFGALKGIGTSGTITTIGPAEPHCKVCGSDYVIEHDNPKYGYNCVCMKCLGDTFGEQDWIVRKKAA